MKRLKLVLPLILIVSVYYFSIYKRNRTDFQQWMNSHSQVTSAIRWNYEGKPKSWGDWIWVDKNLLEQFYKKALADLENPPQNLPDSYTNQKKSQGQEFALTVYPIETAKNIYLTAIAHQLALETAHKLKWSVTKLSASERSILFDSDSFFEWTPSENGYAINEDRHGLISPSPPELVWNYLKANALLGETPHETIVKLVAWAAQLHHDFSTKESMAAGYQRESAYFLEKFWHYQGFPPTMRVLAGTQQAMDPEHFQSQIHWTAGCWGTTGFFIQVLRALNIPVELRFIQGHSFPYFISDHTFLSHGDDPYNLLTKGIEHRAELLLVHDSELGMGIGAQPAQIAVEKISPYLIKLFCEDKQKHLAQEKGAVYSALKQSFPLEDLRTNKLWEKLATKNRSMSCAKAYEILSN